MEETNLIKEIQRAIKSIRFGSVEITIHDGRVTQIERREKFRPEQAHEKTEIPRR